MLMLIVVYVAAWALVYRVIRRLVRGIRHGLVYVFDMYAKKRAIRHVLTHSVPRAAVERSTTRS